MSLTESTNVINNNQVKPKVSARKRKIFVGGLPCNLVESELESHFQIFGKIQKVKIIRNSKSKKSKGFGFVLFEELEAAQKAVSCKSHKIGNKDIAVREALDNKKAQKITKREQMLKLFVKNLSIDSKDSDLKKLFESLTTRENSVERIQFGFNKDTNKFKGIAYVVMKDQESYNEVLKMSTNGRYVTYLNRVLEISKAKSIGEVNEKNNLNLQNLQTQIALKNILRKMNSFDQSKDTTADLFSALQSGYSSPKSRCSGNGSCCNSNNVHNQANRNFNFVDYRYYNPKRKLSNFSRESYGSNHYVIEEPTEVVIMKHSLIFKNQKNKLRNFETQNFRFNLNFNFQLSQFGFEDQKQKNLDICQDYKLMI